MADALAPPASAAPAAWSALIWEAAIRPPLRALDVLLNRLALGDPADETLSVRAARAEGEGRAWACRLCGLLQLLVGYDHCADALATGDVPAPAAAWREIWRRLSGGKFNAS